MERFELEGTSYYQQGRKCGKASCRCATGKLHGPYWYERDTTTGQVKYLGRDLPPEIAAARLAHDQLLPEMVTKRRELANQLDALARLIRNAPLSDEDREIIQTLGFKLALVPRGELASTQDTQDNQHS